MNTVDLKKRLTSMTFTFIDLFCGIGGFHHAMTALGGRCVFACDIDKSCRDNYSANFGLVPHDDIRTATTIPDHDILCAGFPCQPFSNAGHRAGFADETRGTLFYEIIRILRDKTPRGFLLENVKHIQTIQKGHVYRTILAALNELGYSVTVVVLSPDDFGVPQHRERVYFLGVHRARTGCPEMTIPESPMVSILDQTVPAKYKVKQEVVDVIHAWNETLPILKAENFHHPVICEYFRNAEATLTHHPAWKRLYIQNNRRLYAANPSFWDAWETRHATVLSKRAIYKKLEWQVGEYDDSIWNHFIQLRQSGIRVKQSNRFPTLVAMVQTPIYGPEKRFLTPRECARLQSFPESHRLATKDSHAYKHLGNSVNVNVVDFVGRHLLQWMKENS